MKNVAIFSSLLFALAAAPAIGQSAKKAAKKPVSANEVVKPLVLTPFAAESLEAGRVPENFAGHPPELVANGLAKLAGVSKGEFETTADFETRKAALYSQPYIPQLTLTDIHAFTQKVEKFERYSVGVKYRYNADSGEVEIFVVPRQTRPNGIGAPNYQSSVVNIRASLQKPYVNTFSLSIKQTGEREYVASNAYGAQIKVTATTAESIALGLNSAEFIRAPSFKEAPLPVATFKLEPVKAQRELPSLMVLFMTRLTPPYIEYNFLHRAPTRDMPSEFTDQERIIRADIESLVIYSGLTGEIFGRLPEKKASQ